MSLMCYETVKNLWLCEINSVSSMPNRLCLSTGLPVHAVKVHRGVEI